MHVCLNSLFSVLREMNKVSERPGLGAEPAPVGVKFYFTAKFPVFILVSLLNLSFHSLFCRGKRKSLWCGTTPPTNKLYAKPCLHGSRNLSDLI